MLIYHKINKVPLHEVYKLLQGITDTFGAAIQQSMNRILLKRQNIDEEDIIISCCSRYSMFTTA